MCTMLQYDLRLHIHLLEWEISCEQEGIYHGRIVLPAEYPFKPPSFTLLTPNGRFEKGTKICLSISSHHPEHWQPSWSIRTALTALIAFMPSPGHGAIGSLVSPAHCPRSTSFRQAFPIHPGAISSCCRPLVVTVVTAVAGDDHIHSLSLIVHSVLA